MDFNTLPSLGAEETRVLGSLIEKSRATPDYYPMTINALTAACNQKSARKPVVEYEEDDVIHTLDLLKKKGLVSTATGGSSRVIKFKHNLALAYPLVPAQLAILCMLMLRGAQTPGELNTNSGRLYEFENLDNVQQVLEELISFEPALVVQLPKRAGQKEARYMHLFAGAPEIDEEEFNPPVPKSNLSELESRVQELEQKYDVLKAELDKLLKELLG